MIFTIESDDEIDLEPSDDDEGSLKISDNNKSVVKFSFDYEDVSSWWPRPLFPFIGKIIFVFTSYTAWNGVAKDCCEENRQRKRV